MSVPGSIQFFENRVCRDLAGHFSSRRTAHAVAHDEQSLIGSGDEHILIELADKPHIGRRPDSQPHSIAL
jgi:hypothetical protein